MHQMDSNLMRSPSARQAPHHARAIGHAMEQREKGRRCFGLRVLRIHSINTDLNILAGYRSMALKRHFLGRYRKGAYKKRA